MNGLESIKSVNAANQLRTRAKAYATNNPGVSVDEAVVILAGEDAIKRDRAKRAEDTKVVLGHTARRLSGGK